MKLEAFRCGMPCLMSLCALLLNVSLPFAVAEEHRYGLRCARKIDAKTIRLSFGASCVPRAAKDVKSYRIVSMTDPVYRGSKRAATVSHAQQPDVTPPAGWTGKRHDRHTVTVTLPDAMQADHRYYVQILGGGKHNQPITGGRAAMWIEELTDEEEAKRATKNTLGVRRMELVAPDLIKITVGDAFDAKRFDADARNIVLACKDDPDFAAGRPAVRAGRRTRGDCYHTDGWPYGYYLVHEVFAQFDKSLKAGKTYTLDINARLPLTSANAEAQLAVDDRAAINPTIKVNQLGYLPDAQAKYAYIGSWMGSLGALDYSDYQLAFEVRDAATHAVVTKGAPVLRHRAGQKNETVYKHDLSFENVYSMDLSPLSKPGNYYVAVPRFGRSLAFKVAPDIYTEAFDVMMNGIFHQRCGIEIAPPLSKHYRPACHRNMTELTNLKRGSEHSAWKNLPKSVIDKKKHDIFGGHHDAGDYNPRSHLDVADCLMMAYEIRPNAYRDSQLRIPERGNGVPDIIDEARWALDLWVRLQDTDGGVRNGTESDGDPNMITLAEEDNKRDFAFAKDASGSMRFAGAAAQASMIYSKLGKQNDAKALLERAVNAWQWAQRNGAEKLHDAAVAGAIQLYRATGEKAYIDAFYAHSVFKRLAKAELKKHGKYDQQDAHFYYAICSRPVDDTLLQRVKSAFDGLASVWVGAARTTGYRYMRHPWAPNTWGTGCHPKWMITPIQAYVLTKKPVYRKWVVLTCDFALGCNPMNLVNTTRLGQRYISGPLHMFNRYSPNAPIAGIQSEGPSPQIGGKKAGGSMGTWIAAMLYPHGPWPQLHTYTDVIMSPGMNEGIVRDQARTAFAYGFLLPPP